MRIEELDIVPELKEALAANGFTELHPPQAEALPVALSGRNLVAAVPTAGGKSLIGFIPAMQMMLTGGRKVLYIVPLRALASEKKADLDLFSGLGFKVMMSSGDLDSDGRRLADADMIIATSEKADSLIRHGSDWMREVGLVIADEIHMIHDPNRGPTLEIALTKMRRRVPDLQVIALSATISNAFDLAHWLDAELVSSDWRPIPLREGVYFNGEIAFDDLSYREVGEGRDPIWMLMEQTVSEGGQCLVFVNMRRSTESLALKYAVRMGRIAGVRLTEAEERLLEGDDGSTALGRKLAGCAGHGIAFHNAGLTYTQRRFVEENFRNGRIKCIVATPTLAAGINLPARRVIIRDTRRFEANAGNVPIPVMEVKQMSGRAGRPGYDEYGEAVLVAKSYEDYEHLMDDYVMHDTERLTSKVGNERTLRGHILGLIATGDADSGEGVVEFLRETFYGSTSQLYGIEGAVEDIIDLLTAEGLTERDGDRVAVTAFGKRTSDLYIDPRTAVLLRDAVRRIDDDTEDIPILHAAAATPDVLGMYPRKADEEILSIIAADYEGRFLVDTEGDDESDLYGDYFMSDLKTALLLHEWIGEVPEERITEVLGVGPGDIRSRADTAGWVLYAMTEIALIFNPSAVRRVRTLLTRVRHGIRAELLELVAFRGVGRVRARSLHDRGIRGRAEIAAADLRELAAVPRIGPVLARSLKEQVGGGTAGDSGRETTRPAPMRSRTEKKREGMERRGEGERRRTSGATPSPAPMRTATRAASRASRISDPFRVARGCARHPRRCCRRGSARGCWR